MMKINFTFLVLCLFFLNCNSENIFAQCTIQNVPTNTTTISVGTYADGSFYEYDTQNDYAYFNNTFDVLFKINLGTPLSNNQFETTQSSNIFPNPTKGVFNIKTEYQINKIAVCDMSGNLILIQNSNTTTIDLTAFNSGVYFSKIYLDNGAVETKKVIRE